MILEVVQQFFFKEIKGNKFSLSKFELVYINSENKKIERIEGEKIKEI